MLLQLVTNHPEAIGTIVKNTPTWVGGLFAALMVLGFSQARDRAASLVRITIMPIAMTAFSLWGISTAFGASPQFGMVLLAWFVAAAVVLALVAPGSSKATYDSSARTFAMPGSWLPLVLIVGMFMTKYWVGVETAMQPQLAHDASYTVIVGALYGLFSGAFLGRAARLLKMALRPAAASSPIPAFNA